MTEANVSRRAGLRTLAAMGVAGAAVALGASTLAAVPAEAAQVKMADALTALQAARTALANATHDKGGHRIKALALVDEAIAEVKKGMVAGAM